MKRLILAGLSVFALSAIATSPARALTPSLDQAQHATIGQSISTETHLSDRFDEARQGRINKLTERFDEARQGRLNK